MNIRNPVLVATTLVAPVSGAAWRFHPSPAWAGTTPAESGITVTGTAQVVPDEPRLPSAPGRLTITDPSPRRMRNDHIRCR